MEEELEDLHSNFVEKASVSLHLVVILVTFDIYCELHLQHEQMDWYAFIL